MMSQSRDHPEKIDATKEERELNAPEPQETDDPGEEEIIALLRRYYATGFPNPERQGCPPAGEIAKVVRRRRAPDQALHKHLFECSECFREYRQTLAQLRAASDGVAAWSWRKLIPTGVWGQIATASAAILLAVLFAFGLFRREQAPDDQNKQIASSALTGTQAPTSNQSAMPSPAGIAKPSIEGRRVNSAAPPSITPEPAPKHVDIEIDSENFLALRESQEKKTIISLPASRASLVLSLPETAAAGKYTIGLVDAFGRVLLSTLAVSHDGARLRVTLDLSRVAPKKYRLRLSRKDEAPAFCDVIVKKR